jgi:hypothetical protein
MGHLGVLIVVAENTDFAGASVLQQNRIMTSGEVQSLVREEAESLSLTNAHRILLEQAIIGPERISLISRTVSDDSLKDVVLNAWLVGREDSADGYKIVMRDDGKQFGLAAVGFAADKHLVLVGWYGSSLLSAFLAM